MDERTFGDIFTVKCNKHGGKTVHILRTPRKNVWACAKPVGIPSEFNIKVIRTSVHGLENSEY